MSDPREIPILMDAISVQAILDGTKTQTRRPYKLAINQCFYPMLQAPRPPMTRREMPVDLKGSPFGAPGDLLWVRETFTPQQDEKACWNEGESCEVVYRADEGWIEQEPECKELLRDGRWYPSIHMPRWACRLFLTVTAVWLEELQTVSQF